MIYFYELCITDLVDLGSLCDTPLSRNWYSKDAPNIADKELMRKSMLWVYKIDGNEIKEIEIDTATGKLVETHFPQSDTFALDGINTKDIADQLRL